MEARAFRVVEMGRYQDALSDPEASEALWQHYLPAIQLADEGDMSEVAEHGIDVAVGPWFEALAATGDSRRATELIERLRRELPAHVSLEVLVVRARRVRCTELVEVLDN